MTYFCYIDESGTPELPGTSSHFVLVGLAMPIDRWAFADQSITTILGKYGLSDSEVHTAWLLRRLVEQAKIPGFDRLDWSARRAAVARYRAAELLRLQRLSHKAYRQAKKNYLHTNDYVHLTDTERRSVVEDVAAVVAQWDFAFLFAEAIDKLHFDESRTGRTISEQAFEQVVTRFDHFLFKDCSETTCGVLVHDNNQTVAKKHTDLMRQFLKQGTLWSRISRIAETPLFVDSKLTRMVQIADLCSYSLRRYFENGETELFDRIFVRAHKFREKVVGMRHFSDLACPCRVCEGHRGPSRRRQPAAAGATGS